MKAKFDEQERERLRLFEKAKVGDRWSFEKHHSVGTIIGVSHFIIKVKLDNRRNTSFTTRYKINFN